MFNFDPNKEYPRETRSRSIIRFQDCDPLRHLNNAKYFDYFFNARDDQVPQLYGLSPIDLFTDYQAGWVVYQHQIAYIRPALVNEWVIIRSRIIFYDSDTTVVEYVMSDAAERQLKTVLWTTLKYVDVNTGRKITHHEPIMHFLRAAHYTEIDFANTSFAARIKVLSNDYKKQSGKTM
ncbi:MAG: acyl-CoA thioesterase [Bernardetiaceae bacterium]|jgi:acyl-CoA thioester hydrolase|nr:acyl-CoA thioesterase [Bernardetiaceae bacterium]